MKKLREGFTTGSCAAAAALACCLRLRDGKCPERVEIALPEGRRFAPEIVAHDDGSCGVVKDAGDDPDVTDGMEVRVRVEPLDGDGEIEFAAGPGVGTITEPGLKCAVGEPAINPVPRRMIEAAVRSVFGARAARVTVSIPGGEVLAKRTFNPRLGIVGGLSVLGTSGVVRPMSEQALRDSLYAELRMRAEQGERSILFTFGNQGEAVMRALFPDWRAVQVSNELGFMLDSALELGVEHLLIGGHPGKLAKVAAGVMQTHSRTADARREAIAAQLALMGAPVTLIRDVMDSATTEAALAAIHRDGFDGVWKNLARAAKRYCELRTRGEIGISVAFADGRGELLGCCMEGEA